MIEHRPPAIKHAHEEQDCIQGKDSDEIPTWTEMRDAILFGWIIYTNWNRFDPNPVPGCKDQQFEFCLITGCDKAQPMQMTEGIKTIAALGIGKVLPRLESEPEVGEARGEDGTLRFVLMLEFPSANDDGWFVQFLHLLQEQGQILGVMLSIAVNRDCIIVSQGQRLAKTCYQRMTLASVLFARNDLNGVRVLLQNLHCAIRRTIVNHQDVGRVGLQAVEDRLERCRIVVCGNKNDVAHRR